MLASKKALRIVPIVTGVGLLGILILVASFITNRAREQELDRLDNSKNYVIDFSSLLGGNWLVMDQVLKDDEDIAGWDAAIAGRTQLWTYHSQNNLAYIKHHVITYADQQEAHDRYFIQLPILVSLLGGRISDPQFPYQERVFPTETNPKADNYYIACQGLETTQLQCDGLFLYENHVVYVDTFPVRDSVRYLSEKELMSIFSAIDEKMATKN